MRCALMGLMLGVSIYGSSCFTPAAAAELIEVHAMAGALAARQVSSGWQSLETGSAVPPNCELRTGTGVIRLNLGDSRLVIGPLAHLQLDAAHRAIHVSAGRIQLEAQSAWEVAAPRVSVGLVPASVLDFTANGSESDFTLISGDKAVLTMGESTLAIPVGTRVRCDPVAQNVSLAELNSEELAGLVVWGNGRPAQGLGQLVITDPQSDSPVRLDIARYHAHIVLQPPVALVQLDQAFYNPYSRQQEGTFVFNLPEGASVSRFAMYVTPDSLIEGELVERKRASDIYESIVRKKRDPAILEQIGDNLFRMRVFPIFAKDTKRILLDYTLPLESLRGEYQFQLPLLSDLKPIPDFQITGVVRGPTDKKSFVSTTFPDLVTDGEAADTVRFRFRQTRFQPTHDFTLSFRQQPETASVQSYLAETVAKTEELDPWSNKSQQFFQVTLAPQLPQSAEAAAVDLAILADTSSGMADLVRTREIVELLIRNLRSEDRFRLGAVDVDCRWLTEWSRPTDEEIAPAIGAMSRQFPLGATSLNQALRTVEGGFADSDRRRIIIYVGDGRASVTEDLWKKPFGEILARFRQQKITFSAIIVQHDPLGEKMLRQLVNPSGGRLFDVIRKTDGERLLLPWVLSGLPESWRIEKVTASGIDAADIYAPDVWQPDELIRILARSAPMNLLDLNVTVVRGNERKTLHWELPVEPSDDHLFIGRLWAQRKLIDLNSSSPEGGLQAEHLRKRMVALSQEWSLLSPHTAFLVLETEADYAQWGIVREHRRRYWKPTDSLPQAPLPQDWLDSVLAIPQVRLEQEFADLTDLSRAALAQGNWEQLRGLLARLAKSPLAAKSPEFEAWNRKLADHDQHEQFLDLLGRRRQLWKFDPAGKPLSFEANIDGMITGDVSADFLKYHPHARELLREVELPARLSVDEFASLLRKTGANVMIDKRALEDEGIDSSMASELNVTGKLALRDAAAHILTPHQLTLVDEPYRLLITTQVNSQIERRTIRHYPVADLLLTDREPDLSLLVQPYLDHEERAHRQIENQLKRPRSINVEDRSLASVLKVFADDTGSPLVINGIALADEGIPLETRVTMSAKNVPGDVLLKWILEPLDLEYVIQDGALLITTYVDSEEVHTVETYSLTGIVHSYRGRAADKLLPYWKWKGFGGGFGGFSGLGGGMGGSFGGGFGGTAGASFSGMANSDTMGLSITDPLGIDGEEIEGETDSDLPQDMTSGQTVRQQPDPMPTDVNDVMDAIKAVTSDAPRLFWQEIDGSGGTMGFFEPSMDLVVRQSAAGHAAIKEWIENLRSEKSKVGPHSGITVAKPRPVGPDNIYDAQFSELIDLIMNTTGGPPDGPWIPMDGGGGTVAVNIPRLLLHAQQTQLVHEQIENLLLRLRRNKYSMRHGTRPWETLQSLQTGQPLCAHNGLTFDPAVAAQELPAPPPAERNRLAARREPFQGRWFWKVQREIGPPHVVGLTRHPDSLEITLPRGFSLLKGERVEFVYPDLQLMEIGDWGESLRQHLDVELPWWPHRSNDEIARLFTVETQTAKPDDPPGSKRLRLKLRDVIGETEISLDWLFDAQGMPLQCESMVKGVCTQRLRCARFVHQDAGPIPALVILETPAGQPLCRWELLENSPLPIDDNQDVVVLDRREKTSPSEVPFQAGLSALRQREWGMAVKEFDVSLEAHPGHPLLLALQAWCANRDGQLSVAELKAKLVDVAVAAPPGVFQFLINGQFLELSDRDRVEILSMQPEEKRSAADWIRLSRAAVVVADWNIALDSVDHALSEPATQDVRFQQRLLRAEILIRGDQREAARQELLAWLPELTATEIVVVADLCAHLGAKELARAFYEAARQKIQNPEAQRELLLKQSEVEDALPKARLMLAAVELGNQGIADPVLRKLVDQIDDHVAAKLIDEMGETDSPAIRARLQMARVRINNDSKRSADLCWEVWRKGYLQLDEYELACALLNQAGQPERSIEILEDRLRMRRPFATDNGGFAEDTWRRRFGVLLEAAYRHANRPNDRARAITSDADLN